MAESKKAFTTTSGMVIKEFYDPQHLSGCALPAPGEYPYTRGIHRSMYRGKLWTMRQYAGFGSADDTNQRYHFLLKQGISGLSVAFDLPTQMGRDPDHPLAKGEVGRVGVSISTVDDMERLFRGIPLEDVSISMTINATAPILLAFLIVVAERRGISSGKLRGTTQNDILKEYIARGTYIYPPRPALRLVTDIFSYCARELPSWNTVSISGYHIREAGSTAVEEVAFTLADGIAYVEAALARGLAVDDFAPRLAFFFNCHNNFLEEVAKFRAARRLWALIMKERFGAKDERSLMLRFHTQTAGSSLTAQQPYNNIVRTTIQAMAAVCGGTQSLHTNGFDEALGLPTEESARIALRTQQIIAEESGIAAAADPLGGSYLIESWTDHIEQEVRQRLRTIDELGGMLAAIEKRYPQEQIEASAYNAQRAIEDGAAVVVGVNRYESEGGMEPPVLAISAAVESDQRQRLDAFRAARDGEAVRGSLMALKTAAGDASQELMPLIVECVRNSCTLGEISDALREVFGEYRGV
jgi:methylmalonyl-CoA mutase N-terminal domain/subunit